MGNVPITYVTIFDIKFYHFPLKLFDSVLFERAFWTGIDRIVTNYMTDYEKQVNVGVMISDQKIPEAKTLTVYMTCAKNSSHSLRVFEEIEMELMNDIANHLEDTITRHCTHKHKVISFAKPPK